MKILLDSENVFELSETQKKVLCYDIIEENLADEIKRRLEWVVMEKYSGCFKRLKAEWDPRLVERGIEMIPTNKDRYAELVFSQKDYVCRKKREESL